MGLLVSDIVTVSESKIFKLVWNYSITACRNMFLGCNSIIEINFTKFDTSL